MLAAIQVEYAENMPYYLSYLLDRQRWALYQSRGGRCADSAACAICVRVATMAGWKHSTHRRCSSFPLAAFPTVAVATDGLHSLIEADTGARLDLLEVARSVLDFASTSAVTVRRRLRKTLAEYGRRKVGGGCSISMISAWGCLPRLAKAWRWRALVSTCLPQYEYLDAQSGRSGLSSPPGRLYDRPSFSVDLVIFTAHEAQLQVLLVKARRASLQGCCWALPGGFLDLHRDSTLQACAERKLLEKTRRQNAYLEQLQNLRLA